MKIGLPDDSRLRAIRQRHTASWTWDDCDRPPLAIWVNSPSRREGLTYDRFFDYGRIFEYQCAVLDDSLSIGSDLLPVLPINHFGVAAAASMFGAELIVPDVPVTRLQDVGPWIKPVFQSAEAMMDAQTPDVRSGMMPHVIEAVEYYRDNAPPGVTVVTPFRVGPFTLAELLRGPGLYEDLYDRPEAVHHLLSVCADTVIATEKHLRRLLGQPERESITNFGIYVPGVRVNDDSLINLSARMIREFASPYLRRIAKEFGPLVVHYCSTPSNHGEQVVQALVEDDDVIGACTQLGIAFHRKLAGELRGKLAIGSGYGDSIRHCCAEYNGLAGWAEAVLGAAQPTTGLLLHTEVESVEEARRMWDAWRSANDGREAAESSHSGAPVV